MATATILSWVMVSAMFLVLYLVLPRVDPGPTPLTRERHQRFRIVMFAMWVAVSIFILLGGSGHEPGRLETYGLVIVGGAVVYGVIWFKRHWDSRL